MDLGITGDRALVIGGSYGIGFAAAKLLAADGAVLTLCSRDADRVGAAAREVGEGVAAVAADITIAADVERLAGELSSRQDGLEILVQAVGGSQRSSFEALTDEDWLRNYEFNLLGTVRAIRAFLPLLRRGRQPRIVLLGAAAAKMPYEHQVVSNVHKAGLLGLTKTLATELAGDGIRINCVCPGRTLTPLWINRARDIAGKEGITEAAVIERFSHEIPLKRFGAPEEVAAMVAFLASARAGYVTGQSINVDGGLARGLL